MTFLKYARPVLAAVALLAGLPVAAMAQDATEAALNAGREIMVNSGMGNSFARIVPGIMEQLAVTVTRTRPELQKDLKEVLIAAVGDYAKVQVDLVNESAKMLAKRMSEKELQETAAFFASAAGKKYVEAQAMLLEDISPVISTMSQRLSVEVTERVRADLKKRGKDF